MDTQRRGRLGPHCHAVKRVLVISGTFAGLKTAFAKRYAGSVRVERTRDGKMLIARRDGEVVKALEVGRSRHTSQWQAFERQMCL